MKRLIVATLLGLVVPSVASAQYIGIFMDRQATTCIAQVGAAPYIDLHVVAVLGDGFTGFTGAQFQITGTPEGWTPSNALWIPDNGVALSMGHPLFAGPPHEEMSGLNVTFSSCQQVEGSNTVPLGRIILLGAPTPENVHLQVESFVWAGSDPACPFATDCIVPEFNIFCVGGGDIILNGDDSARCMVSVEGHSWSVVKELYR